MIRWLQKYGNYVKRGVESRRSRQTFRQRLPSDSELAAFQKTTYVPDSLAERVADYAPFDTAMTREHQRVFQSLRAYCYVPDA